MEGRGAAAHQLWLRQCFLWGETSESGRCGVRDRMGRTEIRGDLQRHRDRDRWRRERHQDGQSAGHRATRGQREVQRERWREKHRLQKGRWTKCVKDRETQKGRVRESKERQRDQRETQRDRHECTASGGPILSSGSGASLPHQPMPVPTQPHLQQAGFPEEPPALIHLWGRGLPSPHWLGPHIPKASNSPSTRMVV